MSAATPRSHRDGESTPLWSYAVEHPDTIGLRALGFWLYMLSDAMIFAGLFAAHGVYTKAYAGSRFTAAVVLHPVETLLPTLLLFASVLAYGLACVALKDNDAARARRLIGAAFGLGVVFLAYECWEFARLAGDGATPQVSAFLSDYWTIVWAHGLHVFVGLIWMAVVWIQVSRDGFSELVVARMINLRIFWFFQAIIWVCVYTFVYLMGVS